MKLTPWFPEKIKPARPGVYETQFDNGHHCGYSHWTGRRWCNQFRTPQIASTDVYEGIQEKKWRGLAQDPG